MDDSRNERYNYAGCKDMTAYTAIQNVTAEEEAEKKRVTRTIYVIKAVVELAGFRLASRLELEDVKTGRVFR